MKLLAISDLHVGCAANRQVPAIPRFELWCGTRKTEDWHLRYRASVVVSGHLHIRRTDFIDGVRFEEVSLGYPPSQWDTTGSVERYLRQILPALEGRAREDSNLRQPVP